MSDTQPIQPASIILAAGKGTRMGSDLPKVLHPVCGRPMLHWVVDAVRAAGSRKILMVVGHGADLVRDSFGDDTSDLEFILQEEQKGTGHAVLVCREALGEFTGDSFVLAGDGPLIRAETLRTLAAHHASRNALATLATSILEDPTGYGRIIRNESDRFVAIVEHRNATDAQRAICEVYPSYACFNTPDMMQRLENLDPDSDSGEYYLTSIPGQIQQETDRVEVVAAVPAEDVLSINTPEQLAAVDAVLRERLSNGAEVVS
ncbi:MAG: NTP transferase domain-containing protein [Phycisphaerales bacterium]|nr:NTP transferase domain-containing protein [Phycisphaerales bacterium]